MDKIIKVNFEKWRDVAYVDKGLAAWNYGQILQVEGLTLPDGNVEVHFSLTDHEGAANVHIGSVKDNILTVDIPDFIFQKENVFQTSYDAYAWIYVTDGESGRTIRKIVFTIDTRAEPTTNVPEDQKDPFLEEVRQVMAETKEVAQSVRTDADNGKFNGKDGKDGKDGAKGNKGEDGKSAYQYAVEGGYTKTEEEFKESLARAGDVITKEEHEAELLKAFVKVTTDKSAFHHITDSANMKVVDFGMEGITEQDIVSGNQLFDISTCEGFRSLYSGISSIVDTVNNKITTTNTHTSYRTTACKLGYVVAGTYSLSWKTSSSYMQILTGEELCAGTVVATSTNTSASITIDVDTYLWLQSGVDGNGGTLEVSDIMLNKGDTALPIEKYVGGMPSPNPQYEEEVKLAGVLNEETGRYEHKCCVGNKNWLDERKLSNGEFVEFNGVRCYKYIDNNNYFVYNDNFKPNTKYAISLKMYREDNNYGTDIFIEYTDGTRINRWFKPNEFITQISDGSKTLKCIHGNSNYGSIVYLDLSVMQIEVGEVSTDYTQHASQPFTLTSDRPLTMWDNLVKVDGKWYWDYKQLKLVVDSLDKNVTMSDNFKGCYFSLKELPVSNYRDGYCNQLINDMNVNDKRPNIMWLGRNNNYLYVLNSTFYDDTLEDKGLANWKAHLNEHPLEIVTYKDESELVPLLDEEQELLRNLEMYYGVTNIYNEQGCPMWFTYCTDQELHWNQKLLQIQQAII